MKVVITCKRAVFIGLALFIALLQGQEKGNSFFLKKVDFFSSMEWDAPKNKRFRDQHFSSDAMGMKTVSLTMSLLKTLYDKNNYFERMVLTEAKIPKIIHQIWLGPKPLPAVFQQSQQSLKRLHPEWQYKLWTDAEVAALSLHNQKFYTLSDNLAEKTDILRYEILHKFGGVYADVNCICFKPFDILCQYDVWAGLEPLDCNQGTRINNAIIGSAPDHPLLKQCIENVAQSWYASSNSFKRLGSDHFSNVFINYSKENPEDNVIAFPKGFFYPLDFHERMNYRGDDRDFITLHRFLKPESFAVHIWAGSWGTEYATQNNAAALKRKEQKQREHYKELQRKKALRQEREQREKEKERRRKNFYAPERILRG